MAKSVRKSGPAPAPGGWDAARTIVLSNRYGLHMRPSKHVVELANEFPCDIVLVSDGQEVDAKSILGLIGLGAECGASVEIKARGERASDAVSEISGLLESLPELHGEPRDVAVVEEAPGAEAPQAAAPQDPAATDGKGRRRARRSKRGGGRSAGGSRS
jgi:phosphocarrier protein